MTVPDQEELNELYLARLHEYGESANRAKNQYLLIWYIVWIANLLIMVLAILGLIWDDLRDIESLSSVTAEAVRQFVLKYALAVLGGTVMILTIRQSKNKFSVRWRSYRAAAENLRNACMEYRARLTPYDKEDADDRLRQQMEEIHDHAPTGKKFEWHDVWESVNDLPSDLEQDFHSTPDEGLFPRADDAQTDGETPFDKDAIIHGRLQNQRKWYLRKARKYARIFLTFHYLIVLLALFNAGHAWVIGRQFVLVALFATLSFALISWRDFLNVGPLTFQYVETASELEALRKQDSEQPMDVQSLTRELEAILDHERARWYVRRGGAPTRKSVS